MCPLGRRIAPWCPPSRFPDLPSGWSAEAQRDTRVAQPAPLEGARQAIVAPRQQKTQEASCLILHSSLEFKLEAMSREGRNRETLLQAVASQQIFAVAEACFVKNVSKNYLKKVRSDGIIKVSA